MARKSTSKAETAEVTAEAAAEEAVAANEAVLESSADNSAPETENAPETPTDAPAAEQESLMYVGPTVRGFCIQNCVYTEIPADAQEKIKQYPILRNLFIKISQYPKAAKQIRERKGYIYNAYKKALTL